VRCSLQVELSLAKVFQSPTVASLAEVVDMERAALGLPPLKPPKPEIPASPAPLRYILLWAIGTGQGLLQPEVRYIKRGG
jgi:hypothetical protein